jgi:hypothetical protein
VGEAEQRVQVCREEMRLWTALYCTELYCYCRLGVDSGSIDRLNEQ